MEFPNIIIAFRFVFLFSFIIPTARAWLSSSVQVRVVPRLELPDCANRRSSPSRFHLPFYTTCLLSRDHRRHCLVPARSDLACRALEDADSNLDLILLLETRTHSRWTRFNTGREVGLLPCLSIHHTCDQRIDLLLTFSLFSQTSHGPRFRLTSSAPSSRNASMLRTNPARDAVPARRVNTTQGYMSLHLS